MEFKWHDQIGKFKYSISANLSDFRSVMGDLGGIEFLGSQVKLKGVNLTNGMDIKQMESSKHRKRSIIHQN